MEKRASRLTTLALWFFLKGLSSIHTKERYTIHMNNINDWNRNVIEEFRANGGKVGGQYEGGTLLLLTTIGAKSGQPRVSPLGFVRDGDRMVVAASMLGAPKHPDWYHNLVAHPRVTIELGTETFEATATTAEGAERERLVALFGGENSILSEHQAKTTRQIPLVILQRKA